MNYFHLTMLIAYSACRFGDLEREAQERGLQKKSNWRSLKWFACLASCIHLQLTTWKLFLSPRFVLMCKISGGLLLNIQKLFDVYRKLKAWYSSTTIPQVAKWLSKNCGKQDPLNIIFLDFNFNSNKRITEANQNSRLGAYNNTNLILKTTEWMNYYLTCWLRLNWLGLCDMCNYQRLLRSTSYFRKPVY